METTALDSQFNIVITSEQQKILAQIRDQYCEMAHIFLKFLLAAEAENHTQKVLRLADFPKMIDLKKESDFFEQLKLGQVSRIEQLRDQFIKSRDFLSKHRKEQDTFNSHISSAETLKTLLSNLDCHLAFSRDHYHTDAVLKSIFDCFNLILNDQKNCNDAGHVLPFKTETLRIQEKERALKFIDTQIKKIAQQDILEVLHEIMRIWKALFYNCAKYFSDYNENVGSRDANCASLQDILDYSLFYSNSDDFFIEENEKFALIQLNQDLSHAINAADPNESKKIIEVYSEHSQLQRTFLIVQKARLLNFFLNNFSSIDCLTDLLERRCNKSIEKLETAVPELSAMLREYKRSKVEPKEVPSISHTLGL